MRKGLNTNNKQSKTIKVREPIEEIKTKIYRINSLCKNIIRMLYKFRQQNQRYSIIKNTQRVIKTMLYKQIHLSP